MECHSLEVTHVTSGHNSLAKLVPAPPHQEGIRMVSPPKNPGMMSKLSPDIGGLSSYE